MSGYVGRGFGLRNVPVAQSEGLIKGVCAWLASAAELPAWGVRAGAVLLLWLNPVLTGLAYLGLAWAVPADRRAAVARPGAPPPSAAARRFAVLERRLSAVEAATLDGELALRREIDRLR